MEPEGINAPPPLTILRIKRKRNEEPLDALVVESRIRRKRSRRDMGVFQFAQTVENDAWADEKRQKDIQDQISRLASEVSTGSADSKSTGLSSVPPSPTTSRQQKEDHVRRYTILADEEVDRPFKKRPTSPPKVISSKDVLPKKLMPEVKMFDAIPSTGEASQPAPPSETDSEMDKFIPMLNDYLKIHDLKPEMTTRKAPSASSASKAPTTSNDDYVWDVFYHRPATLSEWNVAANVGTLTGPLPSVLDPYDSVSDSEEEDEADEDSNAEEYYKNEYPEDEEPDSDTSDEWHEHSDHDDMMTYDARGSDIE